MSSSSSAQTQEKPNILWITSEDNGPQMGCYGDAFADTPHLDALAKRGVIYTNAWSNAPVCAPARTTIISGMYPPCLGAEHMRSMVPLPPGMKMYPQYLRDAGYYCTNNVKTDYNLVEPGEVWDECSNKAHWRNRPQGKPFFAIFNFTTTHESQIRKRPHKWVHDPDKVRVPAYHPDVKESRQDWAEYYDKMTEMDAQAGEIMSQLEEDGLVDNTIIFYYGDHGPGMPRCKRWPYNSGLSVPMVVYIPDKFKHLRPADYRVGGSSDRLIGFVDLAPTVISLAGQKPPEHMQGRAFLGTYTEAAPEFSFGFRGRMDERYDMVRSIRDQRYVYIRNYMPHLIYGQYLDYMFQTPTTRVWKEMYDAGKLKPPKTYFWEEKPVEELYDLQSDPDEVNNLAQSPDHQAIREELSRALTAWSVEIKDVGFLPEGEMFERSRNSSPYQLGHDTAQFDADRIIGMAQLASTREGALPQLLDTLNDSDSAMRYWAALGIEMRGEEAVRQAHAQLGSALKDKSPYVRVIAAEALGRYGGDDGLKLALPVLLELTPPDRNGMFVSLLALNAIDHIGDKARSTLDALKSMSRQPDNVPDRYKGYPGRMFERLIDVFSA
ncbi:MAG: sulfatase-like hydrolase/transferase [bacterium]|nr:sulfatase-like hydrolase/transferase [bacterium]